VNIGVFAYQNCRANRSPVVETHRTIVALISKADRAEETDDAVPRTLAISTPKIANLCLRTLLIMRRERLVVFPPQLSPLCEIVLSTDRSHFALEPHNVSPQSQLLLHVRRGTEGESTVQLPQLRS
jgi:hypothetical protein